MKAKKKPIQKMKFDDMKMDKFKVHEEIEVTEPAKREGGIIVESVDELLDKLRNEAKVL